MMEAEDGKLGNQKSGIVVNNGTASGSKIIKVVGASQYTASRSTIIATYTIAVREKKPVRLSNRSDR